VAVNDISTGFNGSLSNFRLCRIRSFEHADEVGVWISSDLISLTGP